MLMVENINEAENNSDCTVKNWYFIKIQVLWGYGW